MKQIVVKKILAGVIAFLLLFFLFSIARMYIFGSTDSVSLLVSRIFPISTMTVNGQKILYKDYVLISRLVDSGIFLKDVVSFKENKINCEKVFEQLVYRHFLQELAVKYNIKISREEKENNYNLFLQQYDSLKIAKKEIKEKYGIGLADYKKVIIDNILLNDLLDEAISQDKNNIVKTEQLIETIDNKLKNGEDFSILAKQYSQDNVAKNGGDLGWFGRDKLVPEVENILYGLKKDQIYSEAIKTLFGYHFVKLTDFKQGSEYPDDKSEIRASQILVRYPNTDSLIQEMIKDVKIETRLKKLEDCSKI